MSTTAEETMEVRVWRGGEEGEYESFDVPRRDSQTVLDIVTWIQRYADPTLAYRFACRVGVCGSCRYLVHLASWCRLQPWRQDGWAVITGSSHPFWWLTGICR